MFRSVRFVALLSLAFAPALSAPLSAQQQLFSLDGNSRGGEFGSAVAMIGDVDADGVPDFAVGIPLDGTAGITAGRIRVFSGQTGALLYSVNGSNPGDEFGFSLVGIPDTNGDGAAEILVGAPYADPVGESSGQARMLSGATGATLLTLNGAAAGDRFGFSVGYAGTTGVFPFFTRRLLVGAPFVGFGPLTGLGDCYLFSESGTLIQEFKGFQTDMHSGWSVSGGFDMNGDGVPDIVVGAPDMDFNASDDGRVFVFSGASPYPAIQGTSGWTSSAARSGASVAMLADTNNDGRADILIGAPGDQSGKGSVRVYSGATGGILFSKNGVGAGDHFGTSVASAGDVNGDGRTDIVVGAPDATSGLGTATLCTGVNGVTLFTSTGVFAGGHLGSAVDGGQDLTGDGLPDLIMGSPDAAPIGAEQGNVRVFNSTSHALIHSIDGPTSGDQFGTSICAIGDVNGDGYGDFLIGAPEDDHSILILSVFLTTIDTGSVRCVSGANGSTLWTVYGSAAGDELGFSLTNIGDVNGDGKADFAVGAPQRRAITPQPGYVRIASGANGATIATIAGSGSDSEFGYALAAMHDVTGDGYSEVIVGVPGYSSDRGRAVRVNSGTWTIGLSWFGVDAGERFGSAVAAIGDVNNDNKADVLLGAPSNDAVASGAGRVYCRSGIAATTLFTLSGATAGEAFGTSVAPMMLDTSAAFAIGAPGVDNTPAGVTDCGMVRIYFATTQVPYATIYGSGPFAYFGASLANLGDYFGDGFDDLAAGATENGLLFFGQGQAQVVSGYYGALQYTFDGASAGDQFGRAVARGGDINGDGTTDLLVGSPFADPSGTSSGNVKVFSLRPQGVTYYGTSTPGCSGPQTLRLSTAPKVGTNWLITGVDNVPASTLGLLLVTDSQDAVGHDYFGLGVNLFVDFFAATQFYGLDLNGTGLGHGLAITPIPNNPLLVGTKYYFQALSAWASCPLPPFNLSASNAAEVVILP